MDTSFREDDEVVDFEGKIRFVQKSHLEIFRLNSSPPFMAPVL